MYRPDGTSELDESALSHFGGYRQSKPVLIGNGAARQLQLDIYGELLDSAYLSSKYGDGNPYEGWLTMKAVLHWLADHWRDPDEAFGKFAVVKESSSTPG
jgi:GH15 family glucan-1,4-alpha-glucosidase